MAYTKKHSRNQKRWAVSGTEDYIYVFSCVGYYKIGKTNHPTKRLSALQVGCPIRIVPERSAMVEDASKVERHLHGLFKSRRSIGEWFKLNDAEHVQLNAIIDELEITAVVSPLDDNF